VLFLFGNSSRPSFIKINYFPGRIGVQEVLKAFYENKSFNAVATKGPTISV